MQIRVLYDNEAEKGFHRAWGFSCLASLPDDEMLFDAGWDGQILLGNMRRFGISPRQITKLVLSHPHWDHISGVNHLRKRGVEAWVPKSFSSNLKAELASRFSLHEVDGPQQIGDGVWSTGELTGTVKEQSIVLQAERGLLVLVGCSHPGVGRILKAASQFGEVWGIIGGMHGFKSYSVLKNLGMIVPSHCTRDKAKIRKIFPAATLEGRAGLQIDLP